MARTNCPGSFPYLVVVDVSQVEGSGEGNAKGGWVIAIGLEKVVGNPR